jgi:hypothetical protein
MQPVYDDVLASNRRNCSVKVTNGYYSGELQILQDAESLVLSIFPCLCSSYFMEWTQYGISK